MRTAIAVLLLIMQFSPAYAALGSTPSTLGATKSAIKARSLAATTSTSATTYSISESTLDSGTVVREYANNTGIVFALSWSGPQLPDLRTLLGSHFSTMTAAAAKRPKAGNSQLSIDLPGVVIESGGHMRAYAGRAWIPASLPAGFSAADIE